MAVRRRGGDADSGALHHTLGVAGQRGLLGVALKMDVSSMCVCVCVCACV